ncbi:zinc metalloprotease HtpX [Desulfonatronospira sp.]|uniref:zinc metalloprotease HtpX n=1 Tax=Desulfonatronospira sp. TaxID=1962951 RepID=UPI0025BE4B88|nr:zinc metalloprotease HtpX [Desulfonatronospira sp.]
MNIKTYISRKWINMLHSVLILSGMAVILCLLGWLIAGRPGIVWAFIIGTAVVIITSRISPQAVLRMHNARLLDYRHAPKLHSMVSELSTRAGLSFQPVLFYIPSPGINAFSVGQKKNAAVALTDGMLRSLSYREILGVMAHEISHIRNNDIWIMNLAEAASRVTGLLSLTGQFLLLLNLPLILTQDYHISWWIIILLIFAPTLSTIMQLSLSRTREFDADMDAAMLTNDPMGLARALAKLEYTTRSWLDRFIRPGQKSGLPSFLLTHPRTEDRIQRLISLAGDINEQTWPAPDHSYMDLKTARLPAGAGPLRRLLEKWF